jgi:hypothetical protein
MTLRELADQAHLAGCNIRIQLVPRSERKAVPLSADGVSSQSPIRCHHERTFDNTSFERCIDCGMVRYALEDWKAESPGGAVAVSVGLPWSW